MFALYKNNNIHKLIIGCMVAVVFLLSFMPQLVMAQAGGIPGIDRPFRPGERPTPVTPTTPTTPTTPVPGRGDPRDFVDGGDVGGAYENYAAEQAATGEPPATPPGQELSGLNYIIYGLMVSIGGLFTWFGGLMLDVSLHYFVIGMGTRFLNENFGFTVNSLWSIIRDVMNILFIFVLIYIGIRTILNSDDSGVKKQLGMLIVAALLINFSLLITKTVIDFSNIAAVQIYNAIDVNEIGATGGSSEIKSLSGGFMQYFNLQSYADADTVRLSYIDGGIISWRVFTFGFLMMCVMIIAGFAFLSGAILMLYRFVALMFYMIFSPVMFLGWIYPGFKSYSDKWWQGFMSNAFVAPAYLFMIYLATRMVEGMPNQDGMNFGTAFENTGGTFAVFVYFFVMAGFLFGATQVASKMGAAGASMSAKIGGYGKNMITGMAMMPVNYGKNLGRNVGGGVASTAYRNLPLLGGNASKQSADNLSASRERLRSGEGTWRDRARVGYQAVRGAGSLNDRQTALTASANKSIGGGRSANQVAADASATNQARARRATRDQALNPASSGALAGTFTNIRRANKQQLQQVHDDSGAAYLQAPERAVFLTDAQLGSLDELVNEGTINTTDRDAIRAARNNARLTLSQGSSIGTGTNTVNPTAFFQNMSSAEIAQLDSQILVNMSANDLLQTSDLDSIMRGGRRNVDTTQIRANILGRAGAAGAAPHLAATARWLNGGVGGNGPGQNF